MNGERANLILSRYMQKFNLSDKESRNLDRIRQLIQRGKLRMARERLTKHVKEYNLSREEESVLGYAVKDLQGTKSASSLGRIRIKRNV